MAQEFKLLKTYISELDANLDLMKLKDSGLQVRLEDVNTVHIAPYYAQAVGGIKLLVLKEEYNQALDILSGDEDAETELQELFGDHGYESAPKCPNCGSTNVVRNNSVIAGLIFLILCFVPVAVPKNRYVCMDCDHSWKAREASD